MESYDYDTDGEEGYCDAQEKAKLKLLSQSLFKRKCCDDGLQLIVRNTMYVYGDGEMQIKVVMKIMKS